MNTFKDYKKAVIVDSPNSLSSNAEIFKSKKIETLAFLPRF